MKQREMKQFKIGDWVRIIPNGLSMRHPDNWPLIGKMVQIKFWDLYLQMWVVEDPKNPWPELLLYSDEIRFCHSGKVKNDLPSNQ